MSIPESALHRRFDQNMPQQALRALAVIVAYRHLHSKEHATDKFGEVGAARCGLIRWIETDADVLRIMRSDFAGVSAELVDTPSNGGKHLEVRCGEFNILLIHDVDPDAVVPISNYGKRAAEKNEAPLFISDEQWEAENPTSKPSTYTAVLFHSKESTHAVPCVLEIKFPDGQGGYQSPPINLHERFPELRDQDKVNRLRNEMFARVMATTEVIEDQSHPTVRKTRQAEG